MFAVKNSRNKLLHTVDVAKFNAQYANSLTVKTSDKFHDRFLIIDKTTLIHVGASLNHLDKKCFLRHCVSQGHFFCGGLTHQLKTPLPKPMFLYTLS